MKIPGRMLAHKSKFDHLWFRSYVNFQRAEHKIYTWTSPTYCLCQWEECCAI